MYLYSMHSTVVLSILASSTRLCIVRVVHTSRSMHNILLCKVLREYIELVLLELVVLEYSRVCILLLLILCIIY